MKLRIRAQTLRLRLTQSEVEQFDQTGYVAETIHLGPGRSLTYALQTSPDSAQFGVDYDEDRITVTVPYEQAEVWMRTDQVGFEHLCEVEPEKAVKILIEKDFRCLSPRGAEDADGFPHPDEGTGRSC